MPKDFDSEITEDREFVLGGETFRYRIMHWTEAADLLDGADAIESPNGDGFLYRTDTQYAINEIPKYLDPADDAKARFKAVAARKTDPVPRHQFVQVYQWILARAVGVPTVPPSELSAGGGEPEASSSDESSSKEETSTT